MNLDKRTEEMSTFFNKVVDIDYDELHTKRIKAKERVIDFLPKNINNIIDLGAGTGLQLIKLYKEFPNVHTTAIDVSEGMLRKLKERNLSDNITIVNESFFTYDFGKNVDAVISTQALHHFDPNDKLILYKKVFDCLKDGSVFVIEDTFAIDDNAERQGFEDYKNLVRGPEKHYDTPLTTEHEKNIMRKAGFSEIEECITDEYKILVAHK